LKEWIERHDDWRPNVRKYSLEFVRNLKPRAITRDLDWGVPVPLPGWEDNPHKKIYVWFDAVIGYLSASIEWSVQRGEPDAWKEWWQNAESKHYYVMGKDNITFHTVMWPAILMGAGDLHLPDEIVASEYLNMAGKKLSTSRGQVYLRKRRARTVRPGCLALLPDDRGTGEPGHRLHVGGVRPQKQR